ncbi:hypothetical protein [Actinoallomurus sp. NPDC052274]|uniref:hypothetical protein n=1 Tax=Actinoallomurus sp. NPDC052274 TaxID=3155420 RepID=UPI00343C47A7
MTSPLLYPTSEMVAEAWIASIPGWQAGVGEQLPPDNTTWAPYGYVTVAVVGGTPDSDIPLKKPVVQVDCWACVPGSNRPPWWMAANLAEQIRSACYDMLTFGRELQPAVGDVTYPTARATSVYPLTEPHRVYGDVGDNAGYSFDLQFQWVTLDR